MFAVPADAQQYVLECLNGNIGTNKSFGLTDKYLHNGLRQAALERSHEFRLWAIVIDTTQPKEWATQLVGGREMRLRRSLTKIINVAYYFLWHLFRISLCFPCLSSCNLLWHQQNISSYHNVFGTKPHHMVEMLHLMGAWNEMDSDVLMMMTPCGRWRCHRCYPKPPSMNPLRYRALWNLNAARVRYCPGIWKAFIRENAPQCSSEILTSKDIGCLQCFGRTVSVNCFREVWICIIKHINM